MLKLDNVQIPGSFKIRGIGNMCQKSLKENPTATCLVCSSGGNAGLAASYAASQLGKPIHVFIPTSTPQFVIDQFKLYPDAKVNIHGSVWNEANEKAVEYAQSVNGIMVPPYDHPYLWEGHSTIIDEIESQLGPGVIPSCLVVSVGGGGLLMGLIEGVTKRPGWEKIPLVAMETMGAECLYASVKAGKSVRLHTITSVAKSLGALEPCPELLKRLKDVNVISEVVTDDQAMDACKKFMGDHRALVEPACGAALSAVYTDLISRLSKEGRIDTSKGPAVIIVCGGVGVQLLLK